MSSPLRLDSRSTALPNCFTFLHGSTYNLRWHDRPLTVSEQSAVLTCNNFGSLPRQTIVWRKPFTAGSFIPRLHFPTLYDPSLELVRPVLLK
ncbi:predicted protein [Plenodomus lingam JN3]|uniref:Predicted protein n=1 Tax=Leptosphaeria maculans (strain JN3 / isolate v23.1.3 / race Av1-4-5-6-7-8) TaxID=985895 RepID=E5A0R0_LEPMJ|nr:predicted protein [Plenodomus lingam JN3]CBX97206.1 predicted protein [Plenodomus lingam JN3]